MGAEVEHSPRQILDRLQRAMNDHDLEAFLDCFNADYRSEQPAHPERGFGGRKQVEKNWAAMFAGMPDFRAEVLATTVQDDTVWAEWRWTGTREDGSPVDLYGVTLFGTEGGEIVWGRLYMQEVEEKGDDIDQAVRRLVGREREG
jgi:ketosteroid isomerase-like protein